MASKVKYWKKRFLTEEQKKVFSCITNNKHKLVDNKELYKDELSIEAGYEVLGPILWSFSRWLYKEIKHAGYKKVFFLAREGKILSRAFELVNNKDIVTDYLYVSRRALLIPLISQCTNYREFFELISPFLKAAKVHVIGEVCNIDKEVFSNGLQEIGISESVYVCHLCDQELSKIYDLVKKTGGEYFNNQKKLVVKYLTQKGLENDVCVCDVGWHGTMQDCLNRLLNTNIAGLYLGLRRGSTANKTGVLKKGFLFNNDENDKLDYMYRYTTEVIEMMLLCNEGSTIGYNDMGNYVEPIFDKCEFSNDSFAFVDSMQEAALQFMRDMYNEKGSGKTCMSGIEASEGYIRFAVRPSMKVVKVFSEFTNHDIIEKPIVTQHSLLYYLFQPRKLREDISNSCTIFTVKKLFRLCLPYFSLLYLYDKNLSAVSRLIKGK
jgi:predicted HAD superfamily hydrolase